MNDQRNLEHRPLRAYVHICVCIALQRECDLFDLQWNMHRIWAVLPELLTGVSDPKVAFRDANAYGLKI